MLRLLSVTLLVGVMAGAGPAQAQTPLADPMPPETAVAPPAAARLARPPAPVRDPLGPGMVKSVELPDGQVPPATKDGNFIIGPTHKPAVEMAVDPSVPQGTVYEFTMESKNSTLYPGVERDTAAVPAALPGGDGPVSASRPAPYTRHVAVYVPKQYVAGTAAPFMVGTDGIDRGWFTVLDNLIAQKRVPVMIAISVGSGGGDGPGSERGLEYDTMSGKYAEWVQVEVLPLAEKTAGVKLTDDPDGRGTIGSSSGGAAAMAMAWFHPEWYHRVLTRSGTFVNQQWPHNDAAPHGAFDVSAWSQIELLVDATKGTARMAVAQPPGSKAVEVLDFRETTAGKVGPIALQMHNAGLFDEYRDISIEVDPKEDRLITTE